MSGTHDDAAPMRRRRSGSFGVAAPGRASLGGGTDSGYGPHTPRPAHLTDILSVRLKWHEFHEI